MASLRRLSATTVLCLLVPCLLALVAGCGGADEQAAVTSPGGAVSQQTADNDGFRGVGLTQPYQMPDLTLTDTAGRPFNLKSDTDARVTLVFFGYTNCPDVCSLVMADMASALTRLSPQLAGDVQLLFVTTDPARDTPDVVGEYVDRFHPAFEGLTGPLPRIKAAAEPLGVAIQGTHRLPSGGYEVGHGSQIIGFTDDDKARVVWTEGTPVDDLVSDIHALAERSG
jgi:protein SCO1